MKKYFIIAVAALVAMCACTKNDSLEAPQDEINFAVATYAGQTKAADYATDYGTVPFGSYSWFYETNSTTPQVFMADETVSLTGGAWKPSVTYYWPKTGSIDFISYSPKAASSSVTVTPTSVAFGSSTAAYNVETNATWDLMYADKAIGQTKNITTYYKSGVPTLFRHALSKIIVNVKAAYLTQGSGTDVTSWEITVKSLKILNHYKTGYLELGLNTTDKKSWDLPLLPADATTKYNVWTSTGDASDHSFTMPTDAALSTSYKTFVPGYFVLPQILTVPTQAAPATQTIEIVIDIKTTLPNGKSISETGVKLSGAMSTSTIKAWEINKQITYNLIITPAADDNPDVPGTPVAITFDPAVENWTNTSAEGYINLAE